MNIQKNSPTLKPLPSGWRWVKLGEVCRRDRQIFEAWSKQDANLSYLSLENIEPDSGRFIEVPSEHFEAISASTIMKMPIPLPPLTEQKRIAAILNEQMAGAEQLHINLEAQLREINALPAALLKRAFNGEL